MRLHDALTPADEDDAVHPRSLAEGCDSAETAGVTGIVRLLNTAGGRALCLAGAVDAAAVEAFLRRYGRAEGPARP